MRLVKYDNYASVGFCKNGNCIRTFLLSLFEVKVPVICPKCHPYNPEGAMSLHLTSDLYNLGGI